MARRSAGRGTNNDGADEAQQNFARPISYSQNVLRSLYINLLGNFDFPSLARPYVEADLMF
jgi:hypothetical protein